MKVDGLTNDEVKSHLQKYRLHTRRPSPPPQSASAHAPQLVVLGTIWGPGPDYVAAAAAAAQTAAAGVYDPSASHHSPQYSSYCKSTLPQDHFANFNNNRRSENKPQMQEPDCPQSQQAVSQSQTSPQAPLQVTNPVSSGVGYQCDSGGEEGKSDSTSWKGRPLEAGSGDREEESQIQIKPQAAPAAAAAAAADQL